VLARVSHEARVSPEMVRTAPHNSSIHKIDPGPLDDPGRWAMSWKAYRRKMKK